MNNCKGILGWMFGHKFKSYLTEKPTMDKFSSSGCDSTEIKNILLQFKKKYLVICKRCGERKENL
jgi:hypothetical protein